MYLAERLKRARCAAGLKQEDVAATSGLGVSSISAFENGTRPPKMAQLMAMASVYNRSIDYFMSDREPVPEIVLWREKPPSPRAEELESLLLTLAEHYHKLEVLCEDHRAHNLPDFGEKRGGYSRSDAAILARNIRKILGLGDQPAGVLLNVLEESCGVKVFHVRFDPVGSAACTYNEDTGVSVLLNANHSRVERNADLAHELFHLLTWKLFRSAGSPEQNSNLEDEESLANHFVGELLIPEEALETAVDRVRGDRTKLAIDDIISIARQFDVTPETLLRRMQTVYRIPVDRVESAIAQARELAGRWGVPPTDPLPPARPARFRSLADRAYRNAKISTGTYADYVGISRREAMRLLEVEPPQDAEVEVVNP
jgi:XRE family transcriptional regulator, fatty acid utilization regulator